MYHESRDLISPLRGRSRGQPTQDVLGRRARADPKSFSIAALLHPELATEFEALQDRHSRNRSRDSGNAGDLEPFRAGALRRPCACGRVEARRIPEGAVGGPRT